MLFSLIETLIYCSLILLSFLMISNPLGVNKKANLWFGVFLFFWSSYWFDNVIYLLSEKTFDIGLRDVIRWLQFFTPVIFYISIRYFTNAKYKPSPSWFLYLILPAIFLVLIIVRKESNQYQEIYLGLIWVHAIFYFLISLFEIKKHKKRILLFSSDTHEIDLKWLEYILLSLFFMFIVIAIFNFMNIKKPLNLYINIIVLISVYFVAYYVMKQKEIFPLSEKHRSDVMTLKANDTEIRKKVVSDKKLVELKAQLNTVMNEQKPYLNCDINLIGLSELLMITPHQLSYVINQGFNENFFQFINKFRVEKAKHLLNSEASQKLSIVGIGFESGFSSKTSFNTTFKKITGSTPSEYKNNCSKL